MKITKLETFTVPPRWLFVRLETDDGLVGWGEPILEGKHRSVDAAVQEMADDVVGKDPGRIEDIFQELYRAGFYRGGPVLTSALSGIEQALWDIKARSFGVPVYELMGGAVRDFIKVYAWVGGDRGDTGPADAEERVGQGLKAIKMNAIGPMDWVDRPATVDEAVQRVAAVRETVGPNIDIAVDFHGRVHLGMARPLLRELEPLRLLFVEEPLLPEYYQEFRSLANFTTIPLATGERLYTRWGFRDLLNAGGVALIQPDISHAGGIWELRKIAAMAEAYDIGLAPHCPLGPLALAACIQLDACTPNAVIQEQSYKIHYNQGADLFDYVLNPEVLTPDDGKIVVPRGPGLGVEMNEDRIRRVASTPHVYRTRFWRLDDGRLAEW